MLPFSIHTRTQTHKKGNTETQRPQYHWRARQNEWERANASRQLSWAWNKCLCFTVCPSVRIEKIPREIYENCFSPLSPLAHTLLCIRFHWNDIKTEKIVLRQLSEKQVASVSAISIMLLECIELNTDFVENNCINRVGWKSFLFSKLPPTH